MKPTLSTRLVVRPLHCVDVAARQSRGVAKAISIGLVKAIVMAIVMSTYSYCVAYVLFVW